LQDSLIQGQFYRRILDYIKDENVRKLAAGMPDNLHVQRLYAQALANQSKFSEAEAVLKNILAKTPPLAEEAEAKGLLGRIEKQRYVDAPTAAGAGDHLLNSIRIYFEAYQSNPTVNLWHGINSAALIARAERDGFPIFEFADSVALAKDVLATEPPETICTAGIMRR
jgi:hypothetical protein